MTAPMTSADAIPAAERRNPFWRSVGSEWPMRLAVLLVGIGLGLWALNSYYQKRIVPEELALGKGTMSAVAAWNGTRLNAWRIPDYEAVYPMSGAPGAAAQAPHAPHEALWLGNSQLHAINQYTDGDTTAPYFASEALSWPVYALSLPNASLQEHCIVATWALRRRTPEWLFVPVVFDDTREDGLRPDFKTIDSPDLRAALEKSEAGRNLVKELDKLAAGEKESQGTTHADKSLQVIVENFLEGWADRHWDVWAKRGEIFSTFLATEVYQLRNKIFGITASSKRPRIPLRYEKNMGALRALLASAKDAKVKVIVYIPPLRWDVEPPYVMEQYEACKADVERAAREGGAYFIDIDKTVPTEFWGDRYGDIDFMHFKVGGHRIMAERLVDAVRRAEAGELKPSGGK